MSEEEFLAGLTGHDSDLKLAVEALKAVGQPFCLIDGLAVNHYVEPVVTLDADFAIAASTGLVDALKARGFVVQDFPHSINAQLPGSRLRLQNSGDRLQAGVRSERGRLPVQFHNVFVLFGAFCEQNRRNRRKRRGEPRESSLRLRNWSTKPLSEF